MNNTLIRQDKTFRLHELPKLKSNSFIWNKLVGYTGSVIKRPIKGTLGVYKHMGFIYGFDFNDTLWVIENNLHGVECITFRDFLQGSSEYIIEHNFNPNNCSEIMQRAHERAYEKYDSQKNNCEQFVNYCLNRTNENIQAEVTEMVVNTFISILEVRVHLSPRLSDHKVLDHLNEMRQTLRIKRPEGMQKIFDDRRTQLEDLNKRTAMTTMQAVTAKKAATVKSAAKHRKRSTTATNKNFVITKK